MLRIEDAVLRELLDKALRATRHAVSVETQPDIVFTDRAEMPENAGDAWSVRILSERDAVSYAGPFVLDRNHPLTEGLSLQGVVLGAGQARKMPGSPVILAGNVPLLTDQERSSLGALTQPRSPTAFRHELRLRLRPDLSTLSAAPGWTILIWNLLQWRASEKPGLHRVNFRLGEQVALNVRHAARAGRRGTSRSHAADDGRAGSPAERATRRGWRLVHRGWRGIGVLRGQRPVGQRVGF